MSLAKSAIAVGIGLGVYLVAAPGIGRWAMAVSQKSVGGDVPCEWGQLIKFPWVMESFVERKDAFLKQLKVVDKDPSLGIVKVKTGAGRDFWIKEKGHLMSGVELLALLLAEREWNVKAIPQATVRKGDVILDVGGHVGTFSDFALQHGASKAILLEPDPVNVECIKRNFAKEIEEGRVIVVPEGAWSSENTLELSVGVANSGTSSLVNQESGARKVSVPVRPIDTILAKIGVDKVDYIKMDIEGAEKDALKGGKGVIARSKPRLHLDANHLPDDSTALPALIAQLKPGYRVLAGACECTAETGNRFTPHTLFFEQ